MQRPHAPGGHGSNTGLHRLAHDPVESEEEEVVGVPVVGAHAHALGAGSGPGDGLNGQRQGVPRRRRVATSQKDPHAGLQEVGGDVRIDGLVGVGDAAGGAGTHEFSSVDVPADRFAALQGRREDGVAARVTHGHVHEVHFLAQRRGLGPPVEERANLLGGQVAPGGFKLRTGGRHGARDREEDIQRGSPGVFQHPLDPLGVADVPNLVAVAENGGDAVEQGRLGVGAGRHHRRLDMDMGIDQAGGQDSAARIEEPGPGVFGARARRLHSGDAAGADPNLPLVMETLGVGRKHPSPGDDQVRGLPPHGHCGQALSQGMQWGDGETGQGAHAWGVPPGTPSVLDQKFG